MYLAMPLNHEPRADYPPFFPSEKLIFLSCYNLKKFLISRFCSDFDNNFIIFSGTKIFYDVDQNITSAKSGATSPKMLTNVFVRVVTLASLAEYIYGPISTFGSQIKKCQEEAKEEKDSERVVPRDTEKSFVTISKVLPSQQFDDWPDVVESKESLD